MRFIPVQFSEPNPTVSQSYPGAAFHLPPVALPYKRRSLGKSRIPPPAAMVSTSVMSPTRSKSIPARLYRFLKVVHGQSVAVFADAKQLGSSQFVPIITGAIRSQRRSGSQDSEVIDASTSSGLLCVSGEFAETARVSRVGVVASARNRSRPIAHTPFRIRCSEPPPVCRRAVGFAGGFEVWCGRGDSNPSCYGYQPRCGGSFYFPSTENASRTLPGMPFCTYPELTTTVPPATAGPATFNDPPRPGTPLAVS